MNEAQSCAAILLEPELIHHFGLSQGKFIVTDDICKFHLCGLEFSTIIELLWQNPIS